MKILSVNPGGTSTKIGVFEDTLEILNTSLNHTAQNLAGFATVFDQLAYRKKLILQALVQADIRLETLDCVVGRGGLLRELEGGVYPVDDIMLCDLKNAVRGEHPSNLGAAIAKAIADSIGKPAFVVDPVAVDEFEPVSRISGISALEYKSWLHALNHKAIARQVAAKMGKRYEELNLIVAHLGSGVSVVPHQNGRMVDGSGGRCNGPFSPERSGGLPTYPLIELCFSGRYTRQQMVEKVSATGGMYDYLGTKDMREVERMVNEGNSQAKLILEAFIYQVSKEIAMYGATFCGKVDRIVLTGGIAYSEFITREITRRVEYLAPVEVCAGEKELESLALGALRVLRGEEAPKNYLESVQKHEREKTI